MDVDAPPGFTTAPACHAADAVMATAAESPPRTAAAPACTPPPPVPPSPLPVRAPPHLLRGLSCCNPTDHPLRRAGSRRGVPRHGAGVFRPAVPCVRTRPLGRGAFRCPAGERSTLPDLSAPLPPQTPPRWWTAAGTTDRAPSTMSTTSTVRGPLPHGAASEAGAERGGNAAEGVAVRDGNARTLPLARCRHTRA